MNLTSLLVDREKFVPIELFWAGLDTHLKSKAFRMLEQGDLLSQGCNLLMDESPMQSGLGNVFIIPGECWRDADMEASEAALAKGKSMQLRGHHPEDVIVEIKVYNSEELREFVGFDEPRVSPDEYDDRLFKTTGTKMGAKVWAHAAAALACEAIEPTGKKLTAHLLSQNDLWPQGSISERNLEKHLAPFVQEYKRLAGIK